MTSPNNNMRALLPLFLTVFLDVVGLGIIIPTLSIIIIDPAQSILPLETTQAMRSIVYGFMVACYPLAQFFGAPVLGALSDRHGRKKLLQISLFGTMVGYVMFAVGILTQSITLLFISRLLDGFTGGNISIAQSAIADKSTPENKTRNFGLVGMAFGLGFILGPFIGGKLSDPQILSWFTLSTPYYFAAILTLVNMLLLSMFFNETLHTSVHTPITALTGLRNFKKAFSMPGLRAVFLMSFMFSVGFTFFTQFFNVFLIERYHFDQGDIGNVFGMFGICMAITQGILVRPISRRLLPAQVLKITLLGQALILPLLVLAETPFWMYVVIPFISVFQGLSFPNMTALVSNLTGDESQGEGLGLNQSVHSMGQIFPPMIAGFIAAVHPNLPVIIGSGCLFIAWIVFMVFYRPDKEKFHEE
jgi:MFS transporter, DHA1 family, tetracycline resistance protein